MANIQATRDYMDKVYTCVRPSVYRCHGLDPGSSATPFRESPRLCTDHLFQVSMDV